MIKVTPIHPVAPRKPWHKRADNQNLPDTVTPEMAFIMHVTENRPEASIQQYVNGKLINEIV